MEDATGMGAGGSDGCAETILRRISLHRRGSRRNDGRSEPCMVSQIAWRDGAADYCRRRDFDQAGNPRAGKIGDGFRGGNGTLQESREMNQRWRHKAGPAKTSKADYRK